jgi:hypothetical protein
MLKFKIRQNWETDAVEILIVEEMGNGKIAIAKPVKLEFEEFDINGAMPNRGATLTISGMYSQEFLKALAEALDERNIKTDKDAKIQGTLEATRYHLEDLRKLLKLEK